MGAQERREDGAALENRVRGVRRGLVGRELPMREFPLDLLRGEAAAVAVPLGYSACVPGALRCMRTMKVRSRVCPLSVSA